MPDTVYGRLYFADQDWKKPERVRYMEALAQHRPVMATVLDWEREEQLDQVLDWAEEASSWVSHAVVIIPKVVGGIPLLPRRVGGRHVVLGYSVPSSYGGSPVPIWEHAGWPIHLLGGSPQNQMRLWQAFSAVARVVSLDNNTITQHAFRNRIWSAARGFHQLSDVGDNRTVDVPIECLRRSLIAVRERWALMLARKNEEVTCASN